MRRFLRDVVIRSAEIIKEREREEPINGDGKPSVCMFCKSRPTFQVFDAQAPKSALVCDEHVGPFVTTWVLAKELTLVRL